MFLLDLQSKVPVFEQIQRQMIRFVEAGVLKPGDRLPSVRTLAQENGINPNTVSRAYTELEKKGIVYNIPKKGVYVAEQQHVSDDSALRSAIAELKQSGVTYEQLVRVAKELYKEETDVKD